MKFDPNVDFTNRHILLNICRTRGISLTKITELVEPMRGHSHEEKEKIAQALIPLVESGVYDCFPRHFYQSPEWYYDMNQLLETNRISCDTVRPIVEKILHFCVLPDDSTEHILSLLSTQENLCQMYRWLMDQQYVPNLDACMAKANELCATLPQQKPYRMDEQFLAMLADEIAKNRSRLWNLVYLHGNAPSTDSAVEAILRKYRSRRIIRTDADSFIDETFSMIAETDSALLDCDLYIFRQIDKIAGLETSEQRLYGILDHLLENNRQILITGSSPVTALQNLAPRIRAQIEGGISLAV